jgi:hypothetical protein
MVAKASGQDAEACSRIACFLKVLPTGEVAHRACLAENGGKVAFRSSLSTKTDYGLGIARFQQTEGTFAPELRALQVGLYIRRV